MVIRKELCTITLIKITFSVLKGTDNIFMTWRNVDVTPALYWTVAFLNN